MASTRNTRRTARTVAAGSHAVTAPAAGGASTAGAHAHGTASSLSATRPAVHARQHSANSAGNVFGVLGGVAPGSSTSRERATALPASTSGADSVFSSDTGSKAHGDDDHSPSPPSTSPSTPSTSLDIPGRASSKRFMALYSTPALLKLWNARQSVQLQTSDLYHSFEPPDQQRTATDNFDGGSMYGTSSRSLRNLHDGGERLSLRRSTSGNDTHLGSLGRLSTSSSGSLVRSTSGRTALGIQGGVLPLLNSATRKGGHDEAIEGSTSGRPLLGVGRGGRLQDRDKASPAWTGNRWRHLQLEEDSSSGSDTRAETEPEQLNDAKIESTSQEDSLGEIEDAEWTLAQRDRIKEDRARLRSTSTNSSGLPNLPHSASAASPALQSAQPPPQDPPRASSSSSSRPSLLYDDLLGPTASVGLPGRTLLVSPEPKPTMSHAEVPLRQPQANLPQTRLQAISSPLVSTLSFLQINGDTTSPIRAGSGDDYTPTRRETVEGLEILARRSPVLDLSMNHLQTQAQAAMAMRPSNSSQKPESIFWHYRDPSGQIQGPFSAIQMQDWYRQRYFSETLLVKRVESTEYETLGALVIRVTDASTPFLSPPVMRAYGPPGLSLGPPPIHRSPTLQRVASPLAWHAMHTPPHTMPNSRAISLSNPAPDVLGAFGSTRPDLAFPMQHAPIDPWADTLPLSMSSPSLSRVASSQALAGEIGSARPNGSTSATPMESSSSPVMQQAEQQPLPKPVGRSPSVTPIGQIPVRHSSKFDQPNLPNHDSAAVAIKPLPEAPKKDRPVLEAPRILGPPAGEASAEKAFGNNQLPKQPAVRSPTSIASPPPLPSMPSIERNIEIPGKTSLDTVVGKGKSAVLTPPIVMAAPQGATFSSKSKVTTISTEAAEQRKRQQLARSSSVTVPLSALLPGGDGAPIESSNGASVAPWAKGGGGNMEEEQPPQPKDKATPPALSLREIQAKEQKEAEAKRVAGKRAIAVRNAAEESLLAERLAKETAESLPSNSKWGDASTTGTLSGAAPWVKPSVSPVSSSKKGLSLKEIQEEEGKRKAAPARTTAASISAQKGYASLAAKSSPATNAPLPGWTTVGVSKVAASAASTSTLNHRPPAPSTIRPAAGGLPSASLAHTPLGRPDSQRGPKVEETSTPASPELLKWCSEALKGLDVNINDFVQMLLSFPVPIDRSTRELIADSVYSSSRTLDGRYFADAFADKRAADVKAIRTGKSTPAVIDPAPKVKSMADAIKFVAPPISPTPEFKIVTKSKGKGKK